MVLWWQIVVTLVCIVLSGTFSGLTLGLMSLDIIDLRVLTESGTENERWYARRILPVRRHGNWLLCTLLIGNTAVNSALAIVTADLFGGIAGFLTSTISILYVGEIIPQAVCHRFGLIIGAYAIPFVRLFMWLTAPLSFTTAKALDFFLGGESVTRYNKSQLKSLLSIHGTQNEPPNPPTKPNDSTAKIPPNDANAPFDDHIRLHFDPPPLNATVVELPQITSRNASSTNHPTNILSQSDPSVAPVSIARTQQQHLAAVASINSASRSSSSAQLSSTERAQPPPIEPSSSSASSPIPAIFPTPSNPKSLRREMASRLINFYNVKRNRSVDKSARKDRDKDKHDHKNIVSKAPLTADEVAMLGGAFDFSQKVVSQVMTKLHNVFMLEASLSLNFEVLLLIFQSGHSRVPVYDVARENIIGVLFAKDLILLDPEESVPVKTVLLFFNRAVLVVYDNTHLNEMLDIFKQGGGHMAVVRRIVASKPHEPPSLETLGVVTLEDLIEELIGQDIVDETDAYHDKNRKKPVQRIRCIDPEVLKMFDSTRHNEDILSAKEVMVVGSYLANNTDEFSRSSIDLEVLQGILAEIPIIEYNDDDKHRIYGTAELQEGFGIAAADSNDKLEGVDSEGRPNVSSTRETISPIHPETVSDTMGTSNNALRDTSQPDIMIYSRGVPTKNAYLIINGRVEIKTGGEGLVSEAGPWTLLGVRALTDDIYAPDFTALVSERPARLLRIPRKLYRLMIHQSARTRASASEHGRSSSTPMPPLSNESPASEKRRGSGGSANRSASSLAVAAAAAAVAVGNPKSSTGVLPMPGTSSDAAVVKKLRHRPNGQSLEWSELEPLGLVAESKAAASVSQDLSGGRSRSATTPTSGDQVDAVSPVRGKPDGKPPTPPFRSSR